MKCDTYVLHTQIRAYISVNLPREYSSPANNKATKSCPAPVSNRI